MRRKRKAECTEQEWAEYLAYANAHYHANREKIRAHRKEHNSKPAVKAARALHDAKPESREKRRQRDKKGHAKNWQKVKADPERLAAHYENVRKSRTGFSAADIAALMELQGGRCAVCDAPIEGSGIRADHCHDSKQPRGLLCHPCNIIEGLLKRKDMSPKEFGRRMHEYLSSPPYLRLPRLK